jgi:hypothetical protein
VFTEGMRIQDAGDNARMVVFGRFWEPLQEEQEIGFERAPPCDNERLWEIDRGETGHCKNIPRKVKRELWPRTES